MPSKIALSFLFLCAVITAPFGVHSAFASYIPFGNTFPSSDGSAPFTYTMLGQSTGGRVDMEYLATSTWSAVNGLNVALCRYSGTGTGRIDVEFRIDGTSTPILASSTIQVSAISGGAGAGCGLGTYTNATSSLFVFNPPMAWTENDLVTISFYLRDSDAGIYWSFRDETLGGYNFNTYMNDVLMYPSGLGKTYGMWVYAESFYPESIYNATTSGVTCTTFDVGCYISTALTFLFYPTITVDIFSSANSLASTTPFAYIWAGMDIWDSIYGFIDNGSTSTTCSQKI